MAEQHARFKRWSSRLPAHTAYLVERVEQKIVPILRAYGFSAALSYGSNRKGQVGANVLPFQIRGGAKWPTAEIFFSPDGKPWFRIELAWLQDGQTDREGNAWSCEQAVLKDAREYFEVAKDEGTVSSLFSQFGYHWWSLMPQRKLDTEVAAAERALSSALQDFLQDSAAIVRPRDGAAEGYVAKNLLLQRLPS